MDIGFSGMTSMYLRPGDSPGRILVSMTTTSQWPCRKVPHTLLCENKYRHPFRGQDTFQTTYEILQPLPRSHLRTYHFRYVTWGPDRPMRPEYARLRVFFHAAEFVSDWTVYVATGSAKPIEWGEEKNVIRETCIEVPGGGRYEWAVVNGALPGSDGLS